MLLDKTGRRWFMILFIQKKILKGFTVLRIRTWFLEGMKGSRKRESTRKRHRKLSGLMEMVYILFKGDAESIQFLAEHLSLFSHFLNPAWLYLLWPIKWSRSDPVLMPSLSFIKYCLCLFLRTLLLPFEQTQIGLLDSERSFEGELSFLNFSNSGHPRLDFPQSTTSWSQTPDSH